MENNQNQQKNPAPVRGGGMGGPRGGGMAMGGEKAKNFKKTWVKLIKYCRAYLPVIIITLVAAAASAALQVIGPDKISDIGSEIEKGLITGINLDAVKSIAIMLVFIYASSALLGFLQQFIMSTVTQKISKKMRSEISGKINRLPFSYFNKTSYGDVLSRVTNDVDSISQTLNQSTSTLVAAIAMFVGSLIMMFITSWILALTAIGATIIGFVLMSLIIAKSQKYFVSQQKQIGELNGHIEESYTGHNVIKAYNAGKKHIKDFNAINNKLQKSAFKSDFISGLMMPFMFFIGNLSYVSVCVVGAILAKNEVIGIPVIIAFMIYIRLFTNPLSQIAQAATSLQRAAAAGERVFEFLEEQELEDESKKESLLRNVQGDVEFKNVRFGYDPEKIIINDFSAKVSKGQKVAIVGPTGAGKTTMVNLLMRFYEINGGEILIDGVPISQVPRENVHEQFCMVLQDAWMFEGTIKENIIYSKEGVTDEEVVQACKTVGLHHFIRTLPQGYDTLLNDKASLSEGQKQLVTIARAIIKNSPLLILDEATSSVDTRTERIIQEAMDKLTKGRTSFVIAHRLSTIKNADIILVMKDGDIIESGNHNDLMSQAGFYSQLYNSQFESATV